LIGTMATANVYRFSSKEIEPNTGYYDYGFRFYDPLAQRWVNRDPIGEAGGINLYGFAGNVPVNCVDPFGLSKFWPWSNWDYNPVQACTHAFFEIGALPVEGLLALIDASDKAFEAGKARGKENDNIDNRISIRAGGDAINSALPGIGGDLRAAIGGIPGTVFSGAPPAPNIPGIVTSVGTMIITTPGSNWNIPMKILKLLAYFAIMMIGIFFMITFEERVVFFHLLIAAAIGLSGIFFFKNLIELGWSERSPSSKSQKLLFKVLSFLVISLGIGTFVIFIILNLSR
jgi:RHS repeat-associated protein